MKCRVCGSDQIFKRRYNKHVLFPSLKNLVKDCLPLIDFLIPKSIPQLKKLSNPNTRLFKGNVLICRQCGYGTMENPPTLEQLKKYYQESYWAPRTNEVTKASTKSDDYKHDPRAQHQVQFVLGKINGDAIQNALEIGAGAAYALQLLRDSNKTSEMKLFVCEPGQQWEGYYQAQGIKKVAEYFPFKSDQTYSYIHTSHWLEHVYDLNETMTTLKRMIDEKGFLFIEVPNTEHYYWNMSIHDIPHIHFFTRQSLQKIGAMHGFEVVNIGEFGVPFPQSLSGETLSADKFGTCENGFWIRALFKKVR